MKRFQECSWYDKLWRCRWYLVIPFDTLWTKIKAPSASWGLIWSLMKGECHIRMNWVYDSKEVLRKFKK